MDVLRFETGRGGIRINSTRKEVQGMKKLMVVLMACLFAAGVLAGCSRANTSTETQDPADTGSQAQSAESDPTESAEEAVPNAVVIKTQFGNLYYQDQWEDFMRVDLVEETASVAAAFFAEIESVKYPLFQLTIGEAEGEPVGQLTDAQGQKHDVFVTMEEIGLFEGLTEGEQNRLYAMQEDINFILDNLK